MAERSLGVRETPGSIPGSPNPSAPRVLFLYARAPSGHAAAAAALRAQLSLSCPAARSAALGLDGVHPRLAPLVDGAYMASLRVAPWLWRGAYDHAGLARLLEVLEPALAPLQRGRLLAAVLSWSPDLIVCTHALPCLLLARERARGRLGCPLAAVLTDFHAHRYWTRPPADLYLAADAGSAAALRRLGAPAARVRVTGIPVGPRLGRLPPRETARRLLGLDPRRTTALVSGGARGLGPIQGIVEALLAALPEAQVLAVCGNDASLFERLSRLPRAGGRLRVLPFTRRIPLCLAAADFAAGKAGGVSAAEALAAGLPLLLLAPLPGQEERNAEHLRARGAALLLRAVPELAREATRLEGDPGRLESMRRAAARLGRPGAAAAACRELLGLLRPTAPVPLARVF